MRLLFEAMPWFAPRIVARNQPNRVTKCVCERVIAI